MDYSLQSLKDAFTDAAYKTSRRGYKLYAMLLATTLDQQFLVEYLSLFNELHALTGDDVLVMGVRPGNERRGTEAPIWVRELRSVAAVLRHRDDSNPSDGGQAAAKHFLRFMQAQTAESYELARFLGIRADLFPAMVFFEDLERPAKMVVWPLGDIPATQFAKQLRHLLEEVRERCAWREARSLPALVSTVKELGQTELADYNYSLPHDCREAAKAINRLRNELWEHRRALQVYDDIDELRAAFAELRGMPDLRVPLENAGQTIADVEHRGFGHVVAHERRWRSRLPDRYQSAVAAVKGGSLTIGFGMKRFPPREEIIAAVTRMETELAQLDADHQGHRLAELERRTKELERVQTRVRSAQPALAAVEEVLRIGSCPLGRNAPPRAAFEQASLPPIPRVFISYSHDSPMHAREVLALAQRLRDDGIDCWCDQFESSPAAGFPRWMRQQVEIADFVLLICTPTYRRRFDGAEETGKGLGATYEGLLITQEVYDAGSQNTRFIPVLLAGGSSQDVPVLLRGSKWYEVPQGYDLLLLRLTGSEAVEPHPLGRPSWRDRVS